jgi:hypothetical protein
MAISAPRIRGNGRSTTAISRNTRSGHCVSRPRTDHH